MNRIIAANGVRFTGPFPILCPPVVDASGEMTIRSGMCLMVVNKVLESEVWVEGSRYFHRVVGVEDTCALWTELQRLMGVTEAIDAVSVVSEVEDPPSPPPIPTGPPPPPIPTGPPPPPRGLSINHVYMRQPTALPVSVPPLGASTGRWPPPKDMCPTGSHVLGIIETSPEKRRKRDYNLVLVGWEPVSRATVNGLIVLQNLGRLPSDDILGKHRDLFFDEDAHGDRMWVTLLFLQAMGSPTVTMVMDAFVRLVDGTEWDVMTKECRARDIGSTLARAGFVEDLLDELDRTFNTRMVQCQETFRKARQRVREAE